jgi:hypothetical protein
MAELQTCADFFGNEEPEKAWRILLMLLWETGAENIPSYESVREWLAVMESRKDRALFARHMAECREFLGDG